jgi:PST family polysaccharide transporter
MKTTGVVGAVQIVQLAFGLVRNKLIAYFLGPAGLGIWSLYLSLTEMMQSASSLGLEKSGVKQVSQNQHDEYKKNLTIKVVQVSISFFSLLCSISVAIFAEEFSESLFGTADYKIGIWVCSSVIFLNAITNAYRSILNGLSEIRKLAISQLIGILVGNIIVFSLIPFFDLSIFPIYFLIIAISAFTPTFFAIKKLQIPIIKIPIAEAFQTLSMLMKIGFAFWMSAVFMTFVTYMTNIFLKESLSIEAVGIYQASWTISNLYIGIILSSMGVAFFPQICKLINNNEKSTNAINQQIELSLLISLPFVIGIYIFAPILLTLLYSAAFAEGASIIRWQILGVAIRLFGFPFGYALMAKGKAFQYMVAQFIFSGLNYLFIVTLVLNWGFGSLGSNYFLAYIVYVSIVGILCKIYINYSISTLLLKITFTYFLFFIVSAIIVYYFSGLTSYAVGSLIVLLSCIYSHLKLKKNMNIDVFKYLNPFKTK